MKNLIRFKKMHVDSTAPTKANPDDGGHDFYAYLKDRESPKIYIDKGKTAKIPTGIKMAFTPGFAGLVMPRSSGSLKGWRPTNIIDAGYRGEIFIIIQNGTDEVIRIHHGDKIAQIVFVRLGNEAVQVVEELDHTERGEKGFGSSDKKKKKDIATA